MTPMIANKHRVKQLSKLIDTWAPLVGPATSSNRELLHHRAHLSALIRTMLFGKYPL